MPRRSTRKKTKTGGGIPKQSSSSSSSSSTSKTSKTSTTKTTKNSFNKRFVRRKSRRLNRNSTVVAAPPPIDSDSSSSDSDSSSSDSDFDGVIPGNLFETELTRAQKQKINENILKQQKMIKAYEEREKSRTINDLIEMMECTKEEAETALQQTKGNHDKAINKLIILKRKQERETRRKQLEAEGHIFPGRKKRKLNEMEQEPVLLPANAIVNTDSPSSTRGKKKVVLKPRVVIQQVKTVEQMKSILIQKKKNRSRYGRVTHKATKKCELINIGKIDTRIRFSNHGYIFPVGYKSYITYISSKNPNEHCKHLCEIVAPTNCGEKDTEEWKKARPIFRITADDRPDEPVEGFSATGPWKKILVRINVGRKREKMPIKNTAIAGPEYFGLNAPNVIQAMEALPNAEKCTKYWAGKEVLLAQRGLLDAGEDYGRKKREKGYTVERKSSDSTRKKSKSPKKNNIQKIKQSSNNDLNGGQSSNGNISSSTSARSNSRRRRSLQFVQDVLYTTEHEDYQGYWSTVGRTERLKNRRRNAGETIDDLNKTDESNNPLYGKIDKITLDPIENPHMSPAGHVLGLQTWLMCIKRNKLCPFTKKRLKKTDLIRLTKENFDNYRSKIVGMDL